MLQRILLLWLLGASLPVTAATILVFGDSLSAGYGLTREQGWVSLLQKELAPTHTVINASVSGETTAGGVARLPMVIARVKPTIVVLELGGNDGLQGLPLNAMRSNLAKMIELCQKAGARLLLVGIALPPNYGAPYTKAFHDTYRELAHQYRLAWLPLLIDGFEKNLSLFQADGIHPTAAAQPYIMQNIKNRLPLAHRLQPNRLQAKSPT